MKILRAISSIDFVNGGPINGLVNSTKLLQSWGHEVHVVSLDDIGFLPSSEFPCEYYLCGGGLGNYRLSRRFRQWLELNVEKYDVVIIHGLWQYHSYATAKICVERAVPYVLFTHGMLDPWFNDVSFFKKIKKTIYWKIFEKLSVNNADRVLFTSQEERDLARKSFLPYSPAERVVAYGSPVPSSDPNYMLDSFYQKFPELKGKRILLFLSRIHEKKGIDLLVEEFSKSVDQIDDYVLVVCGPDNDGMVKSLKQVSSAYNAESRIHWLGMVEGDTKWGAYLAADAFILPSHQENFGIVVSESLSVGTPVLISNKVNIWREVQKCGAGLVQADDSVGVRSLLLGWVQMSDAERDNMAHQARACYEKYFSIKAAASDLQSVLIEVSTKGNADEVDL